MSINEVTTTFIWVSELQTELVLHFSLMA